MASARGKSTVVARLKKLEPTEFENLTYDILFLSGVQNLRWAQVRQRWYVECKRYAQSLNWPTVYEKLTIAINHNAL